MAKRTIPEVSEEESVVSKACYLERQIVFAERKLADKQSEVKIIKEEIAGLIGELRGLFADESRPLFDREREETDDG